MKTIIAGTDFTASSVNACKYAALLAQKLNCKLVIFNLHEIPMYHATSGLIGITFPTLKAESEYGIRDVIAELSPKFPALSISALALTGNFKHEIKHYVKEHKVEAVVMGLNAGNKISKFIYESHGVTVAGKIDAPVIIVPKAYTNHKLETVLLAVDNLQKLKSPLIKKVERFIKKAQLHSRVLHVRTPDEVLGEEKATALNVNGEKKKVEFVKSKDVETGIKRACEKKEADLVVMISSKHSIIYNLFNESMTKRVVFEIAIPVMAIHE